MHKTAHHSLAAESIYLNRPHEQKKKKEKKKGRKEKGSSSQKAKWVGE
jgi:hypothetical protein